MFKAGKYYVGDLGYAVREELWSEFADKFFENDGEQFEFQGQPVFAGFTAHGDGRFKDNSGRVYPVDAGMIGCIADDSLIVRDGDVESFGGHVIEFEEDFEAGVRNGVFTFGNVRIDTN